MKKFASPKSIKKHKNPMPKFAGKCGTTRVEQLVWNNSCGTTRAGNQEIVVLHRKIQTNLPSQSVDKLAVIKGPASSGG